MQPVWGMRAMTSMMSYPRRTKSDGDTLQRTCAWARCYLHVNLGK